MSNTYMSKNKYVENTYIKSNKKRKRKIFKNTRNVRIYIGNAECVTFLEHVKTAKYICRKYRKYLEYVVLKIANCFIYRKFPKIQDMSKMSNVKNKNLENGKMFKMQEMSNRYQVQMISKYLR